MDSSARQTLINSLDLRYRFCTQNLRLSTCQSVNKRNLSYFFEKQSIGLQLAVIETSVIALIPTPPTPVPPTTKNEAPPMYIPVVSSKVQEMVEETEPMPYNPPQERELEPTPTTSKEVDIPSPRDDRSPTPLGERSVLPTVPECEDEAATATSALPNPSQLPVIETTVITPTPTPSIPAPLTQRMRPHPCTSTLSPRRWKR